MMLDVLQSVSLQEQSDGGREGSIQGREPGSLEMLYPTGSAVKLQVRICPTLTPVRPRSARF
jgi:hypothetical protein